MIHIKTPTDFKGTIQYYNPSKHYSRLPIHARLIKGGGFEAKHDDEGNHVAMCHGNLGLPVLSYDESATPENVTCITCLRMLESGERYGSHSDESEEDASSWI
ncbi:hypothetical protein [Paenibacillus sp. Mc5Re-14]|uniref:hypothetical protein n=1 Tax=Paenibacillus sp. Mc5Re-14 TaxID=1030529 RepID=UPI000AFB2DFF|nr:hypothetical protein [Paenibacillus sp. Mc5Re-14]